MKTSTVLQLLQAVAIGVALTGSAYATPVARHSALSLEAQKIRFPITSAAKGDYALAVLTAGSTDDFSPSADHREKSPIKAFLLSAAVPGLGQYYYGSRVKPFVFLGVEAAAWSLYFKWHGDGMDATRAFELFQQTHWSRDAYENKFLLWTYGHTDDDSIVASEVSHHLPDESTQQYYEMTGKYDQFAWGWDDAVLGDRTLDDYSNDNKPPRMVAADSIPYSARRFDYEEQRHDANQKLDRARKMIMVSVANRLVSALEAFLVTRHRNETANHPAGKEGFLSNVKVDARLKSYHEKNDTPFVKFTYSF
jgi:hypothetical protein